jgi:hypothetical protein
MFLVDILIYILSIILCFFAIILNVVMFVTINEWLEKNNKKRKKKRNVRDN